MSLLLLLASLLPWATSPASAFTRIFTAISLLSVEMQLVTLTGLGSLRTLPIANAAIALLLAAWQWTLGRRRTRIEALPAFRPPLPLAVSLLTGLVLFLNVMLPLEAADPYHLQRIDMIERSGTLAYDPAAEPKVNILGWVYELVLADFHQVPGFGGRLMAIHGMFGVLLYTVALSVVCGWLPPGRRQWPVAAMLVVPAAFHQFVLIKNDLFVAAPALVALAWLVAIAPTAPWTSYVWAGWLVGFVVGYKLTNLPLAVIALAVCLTDIRHLWRRAGALALGGLAGVVASGLLLTLWQNTLTYGDPLAAGPVADIGNRTTGLFDAARSVMRFGISLLDLGLVTPAVWPGRGGWGGTFGLPFIWATAVLVLACRKAREARWALAAAAFQFVAFSAVFPDADLTQRLALAPALLIVAVAVHLAGRGDGLAARARIALVPVLMLSAAQILRSAVLYLSRA